MPGLVGKPPQLRVVEAVRQFEAFIPAIGRDIGGLAREVDLVFGVDFKLLGDLRLELAEAGPNPLEFGDADMGMRQQFESTAPLAVLVESEAMAIAFIRRERDRLGKLAGRRQGRHFLPMPLAAGRPDAAQGDAFVGQALVRVVGPQRKPVLRTRCEHAVGLGDPACYQIINHNSEIALGAVELDGPSPARSGGGIETSDQALRGGLLIACRAIDLPCQEQPGESLSLQGGLQFARVHMIVFDGISGPEHPGLLQPRDRRHQRELDLFRQRGGDAVGVDGRVVESLRLQKDLVPIALAKADDLVLD